MVGHTAREDDVRVAHKMSAICIDSAMLRGSLSFFQVTSHGHMLIHQLKREPATPSGVFGESRGSGEWQVSDITSNYCAKYLSDGDL